MPRHSAGMRSARYQKHGPQARTLYVQMNLPDALREDFDFLSIRVDRDAVIGIIESAHPRESDGYRTIMRAFDISRRQHWERRRHSGEREFKHLVRCFLIAWFYCEIRDPDRLAAIWLHDLCETFRRKWTLARIEAEFNARVAQYVARLTKEAQRKGVDKREVERRFYAKLAGADREDVEHKGIDVLDNLITLWKRSVKRIGRKIDDVIRFLLPLLRRFKLSKILRAVILVLDHIRHKLRNGIAFAH